MVQPSVEKSELSILMLNLTIGLDTQKNYLLNGRAQAIPELLQHLKIATPTWPLKKNENFNYLADDFIEVCGKFYTSKNSNKTLEYNAVIQSCKACHLNYCPGPLKKINKMFAETSL